MSPATAIEPATMSREEAARSVGLRPSTLARMAARDVGPRFVKLSPARSGRVRYVREHLDAWLRDGAPTDRGGARPEICPRGCFPRPDHDSRRNPDGRFSGRPRNPQT